jgi:hypothetical protein
LIYRRKLGKARFHSCVVEFCVMLVRSK